ncbi:MAG: hypothetical protein JST82_14085 [Bacteroidetes bacterium]|nr:hypothetical protein [Bacteroidota bacterium]
MKSLKQLLLLAGLLLTVNCAMAQGPGFDDDVVDEVPLDGGVSALVVAGVAYGAKKLKEYNRKK